MTKDEAPATPNKFRSHHFRIVLLLLLALLLVIFTIQNSHEVAIKLWFWKFETSMALAIIICIIAGFIISFLYTLQIIQNKNKSLRQKDKEISRLKDRHGSL